MTNKVIERAVNEARIYGDSYLGEISFNVMKDSKKVNNYLKKNNIADCWLTHVSGTDHNDGWYIVCK